MFNKVANDVFLQIIFPNWKRSASYSISPRPWLRAFTTVARDTNIISVKLATSLASSPSLLRVLLNSFSSDKTFASAKEFAINIAFEISQPNFTIELSDLPELWRLREFATAVRLQWLNTIETSFIFNSRFQSIHNISTRQQSMDDTDCSIALDNMLCNRDQLTREYFAYYNVDNATTQMTVWLPDSKGYVATDSCSSITLSVLSDIEKGAELGFFRQNFDYSIGIANQRQWLQESSIDRLQALESAKFENLQLGHLSKHIVWSRDSMQTTSQAA
ncbi:MAG: hypothetical protein ACI9ES_002492 [Oceanospirillaceae bacterium]|jgi:hypothetical protein